MACIPFKPLGLPLDRHRPLRIIITVTITVPITLSTSKINTAITLPIKIPELDPAILVGESNKYKLQNKFGYYTIVSQIYPTVSVISYSIIP